MQKNNVHLSKKNLIITRLIFKNVIYILQKSSLTFTVTFVATFGYWSLTLSVRPFWAFCLNSAFQEISSVDFVHYSSGTLF